MIQRLLRVMALVSATVVPTFAAPTLGASQLSHGPSTQCNPPAAVTGFRTSDTEIWAYFLVNGGVTADVARVDWLDPSGNVAVSTSFNGLPSSGNFCFDAPFSTSTAPNVPTVGNWTVRLVWNGSQLGIIRFAVVQGVTVRIAELSRSAAAAGSCTPPLPATSFATSDTEIWSFITVDNAATNDFLEVFWVDQNGNQIRPIVFNPVPSPGSWCYSAWLSKATDLYTPAPGTWTVQFYWNNQLLKALNFQVTGATSACTFTLNPGSASPGANGGPGSFQVNASGSTCAWSASTPSSFISISSGSGTGNGTVNYSVASNSSTSSRSGTIAVGNASFTVTQAGITITGGGGTPVLTGALNAASYMPAASAGGAIAQGSLFSIFGSKSLGPTQGVQATSYPIANNLAGISIVVTQGSVTVNALPIYVSDKQINAIMPSNAPLGQVQLTVINGSNTSNAITITIAASNFGAFSATGTGQGPAAVLNYVSATNQPLNTLSHTAMPNQVMILYGTGLGAVSGGDNVSPPVGNLPIAVAVFVGGKSATVMYSGRAPGSAAEDQINFQIPPDAPTGCYVPVVVRTGTNSYSNTVTIAVHPQGQHCAFTTAIGSIPTAGGTTGAISLLRIDAVAPLDPTVPPNTTIDIVTASFQNFPATGDLGFSPTFSQPAPGSCAAYTGASISVTSILGGSAPSFLQDTGGAKDLDAGNTLSITGPNGMMSISRSNDGSSTGPYLSLVGGFIGPLFFSPGSYTVSGTGGNDIGAFQATTTLNSSNPTWSNRDQISTINRSAGVSFTWTGGDPSSQVVLLGGGSSDKTIGFSSYFLCMVNVSAGQFTVPVSALANMPATANPATQDSLGILFLMAVPAANPKTFTAPGINATGYIVNQLMALKTLPVQ